MLDLGMWGDERLARAVDRLARSVTGDGYDAYLKSAIQGPGFACRPIRAACGWGAIRVLWALNAVPAEGRTPVVEAAVQVVHRLPAALRHRQRRLSLSGAYQLKLVPVRLSAGYVTDLLLNLEALTEAGVSMFRGWMMPSS